MPMFVFLLALLATSAVHAQDVYVVMHTAGAPDAGIHTDVNEALANRGVAVHLSPSPQELASGLQAQACRDDADVCALAVGRALGATRVVSSTAQRIESSFTLELALHELQSGVVVRRSLAADSLEDLRRLARIEVLTWARQEMRGRLLVTGLGANTVAVVDGNKPIVLPMKAPLPLAVGEHKIEARVDDGPAWSHTVSIDVERDVELALCATGSDIAVCASSGVAPDRPPLLAIGVATVVVGGVGMAVGAVANAFALMPATDGNERQTHSMLKAASMAGYIAGSTLVVVGAGFLVANAVVE
jgi:hypothetical protein